MNTTTILPQQKYDSIIEAAINGDLEALKKMHLAGFEWNRYITAWAAEDGHLDCLKYAHENGCEWDTRTTECAAQNGHLDCLKYAHENGCDWDESVPSTAALNGHLDCLRYAHENGCQWEDIWTTAGASQNGYLDCLKYAHENGCKWDEITPKYAAENGEIQTFKYCFSQWTDQQAFWNIKYDLSKILNKIDLDDPVWRKLFELNLNKIQKLKSKVQKKKNEIENTTKACMEALKDHLPTDVIQYCINPYF